MRVTEIAPELPVLLATLTPLDDDEATDRWHRLAGALTDGDPTMTDTPLCATCLLRRIETPATHQASRFGVRPDHPPGYFCDAHAVCDAHADWGWDLPLEPTEQMIRKACDIPRSRPRPERDEAE